ncbi:MAG: radical SAM protein [Candidatus Omnitrophica bacterium]|nr:radical SAM protein [Candidatus Omnitrophota bacterium]MDE2223392.1 radical SAM protein [Candidatus Omnitrophota bacterium]
MISWLRNPHLRTFLKFTAANALPAELFDPGIDINLSRQLFKSYVKHVEVEHHSYCNRTCWFCPNSTVDRRSTNIKMDRGLLTKILRQLSEIHYDQLFVWSGYNEPLADETMIDDVRLAKQMLPKAYQRIYTNGDYLSDKVISRLEEAGLDQLRVSLYPLSDYETEKPKLLKGLEERTGLKLAAKTAQYEGLQLAGSSLLITVEVKNFRPGHMSSRGGSLAKESGYENYFRTMPCFYPVMHLAIAYDGHCMLCCQVRPDIKEHRTAIIGDLNNDDYSLFHYYRDLAPARAALLGPGPKGGVCSSCSVNPFGGGPYRLGRMKMVSKILNSLPGNKALMDFLWLYPRTDRGRYKNTGDL